MVKMRRLPEDDYMHEPETASNFNESRYYNWFDHQAGTGGWVRMGNRVNEGYAELTVCLYLPDGSVGFMFKRPKIETNAEHNAGGLRFEVLKPYEEHRITFDGKVCVLTNPREMAEPREAFDAEPPRAVHDRPAPEERRPGAGRRARVGGGRAEARPRSREDVRPRPHRAAHALDRHRHRRRPDASTSPTASACATTHGARATGRTSGGTAGSPSTSAKTSASR